MEHGHDLTIICETGSVFFPYKTSHAFELNQNKIEMLHWFAGKSISLPSLGNCLLVENVNSKRAQVFLENAKVDLVFSFGSRRIKAGMLSKLGENVFNFHGANPEKYRGLDSHLWALWHNDDKQLATCLHCLTNELDDGDIYGLLSIDNKKLKCIEDVRILNTENCVRLALDLIAKLTAGEKLNLKKQMTKGRYYSAMPSILKDVVVKRFMSRFSS